MIEGNLYEIKSTTVVESTRTTSLYDSTVPDFPILKGWRQWDHKKIRPPFIYLGYKMEDWKYSYQNTSKIHYVLWEEKVYVMDNQFAKHVEPVWEGGHNNG